MARSVDQWGQEMDQRPVRTIVLWVLGLMVFSMLLGWLIMGNDFFVYKFFAPRQAAVQRQVYEQTKSYRQGSIQRLGTLCTQVASADSAHVPMLYGVITQEFAEWNVVDVPDHLKSCLGNARAITK